MASGKLRESAAMRLDVTFVIAAYNAEASVARAIRSALDQKDVSVEVVVVDDCSRDRTVEIARSFPEGSVHVVSLGQNRGPGGARNVGFSVARGRWVAVLDSDDTVAPERLARMIGRAESANAQIVVDNLEVVRDADGGREMMFESAQLAEKSGLTLADFIAANIMFEETFSYGYMKPIFQREFIEQHALRYDEQLRIGEDYIFLASALAKGARCAIEPEAGYAYHIREGSISRVMELRHVEAMLAADARFVSNHEMDPVAGAAQARRTRSLKEAAAFLSLVQHLKDRAPLRAAGAALRDPIALRHLKMPIAARLRRLAATFQTRRALGQAG
jgi:succinoglycan biosynthesis protein ExoO